MTDPAERRAADALGLARPAGAAAAQAAFLTLLGKSNFAPSPLQLAALALLGNAPLKLPADAREAFAELETADLEAFKAEFWSCPAEDRRERWQRLRDRTRTPALIRELERLEAALPLEWMPFNAESGELGRLARDLYLLPPRARAARRGEWLAEHSQSIRCREAAFAMPELKLLDAPLHEALTARPLALYSVFATTPELQQKYAEELQRQAERDRRLAERAVHERLQFKDDAAKGSPGWSYWIVLFVIIGGIRACASLSSSSSSYAPPPRYTVPTPDSRFKVTPTDSELKELNEFNKLRKQIGERDNLPSHTDWQKLEELRKRTEDTRRRGGEPVDIIVFTPAQIEAFKKYDPQTGKLAPPGYDEWRRRERGTKP